MEDQAIADTIVGNGISQSISRQFGIDLFADRISDYLSIEEVYDHGKVHPANVGSDVSDISGPHLVRRILFTLWSWLNARIASYFIRVVA